MDDYSIAPFPHITVVLGLSAAIGLEWTGLRDIRRSIAVPAFPRGASGKISR